MGSQINLFLGNAKLFRKEIKFPGKSKNYYFSIRKWLSQKTEFFDSVSHLENWKSFGRKIFAEGKLVNNNLSFFLSSLNFEASLKGCEAKLPRKKRETAKQNRIEIMQT